MRPNLKNLFFSVILFVGSLSFAKRPQCSDLFGPSIEALLERAGQLEFDLSNSLILKHSGLDTQSDVRRLEQVQSLIEDIFAHEGSEKDLILLSNRLDVLFQKREAVEFFPKVEVLRPTHVVEAKTARKDYESIQYYLKEKYNKFLDEVSRVHSLAELSPSWSLERIDVFDVTREPSYSVRLNQGYRVLFVYEPETGVKVLRISMKVTHNK